MKLHGMWVIFHGDVLMALSYDCLLTLQFRNFSVSIFSISLYVSVYWFRLIFYKCSQIKLRALQKPSEGTLEATIAKGLEWGLEKINKNQGRNDLSYPALQSSSWWLLWTELHRFFFIYFLLYVGFPSHSVTSVIQTGSYYQVNSSSSMADIIPLLSQGGVWPQMCQREICPTKNWYFCFFYLFFAHFQE